MVPDRSSRQRRGVEAVEFALVFPVFVAALMGGMEFSWFLAENAALITCVREGARTGSISVAEDAPTNAIAKANAQWNAFTFPAAVVFTSALVGGDDGVAPELTVEVTGTMTYQSLTGLVPEMAVDRTVVRTVAMRLEDQAPPLP